MAFPASMRECQVCEPPGGVGSRPCAAWVLSASLLAVALLFDRRLTQVGRGDLRTFAPETWVLVAGMVSALVVGTVLAARRPEHPAGWLFLGLGLSMAVAGPIDGYATYGVLARAGSLPGAAGAAHLGDVTFVPWLVLIAIILHLTPTGHPLTRAWGRLMWVTVVAGVLAVLTGALGERALDPPFEGVSNPWAIHALSSVFGFIGFLATFAVGVGLIGASASMVVRYRRALGVERAQLKWMYLAAVPLPLCVPAAFLSAWTGHPAPLLVATGGFVVVVPIVAGLAIARFHLYEVDRILSRALTYALLSAVLTLTYVAVVLAAGRAFSYLDDSSAIAAALATFVAVTIASPVRSAIQDGLDRRFNRRRFEAVRYTENAAPGARTGRDRRRPAQRGGGSDAHRRLLVRFGRALDHGRRPATLSFGKCDRRAAQRPRHCPRQLRHCDG